MPAVVYLVYLNNTQLTPLHRSASMTLCGPSACWLNVVLFRFSAKGMRDGCPSSYTCTLRGTAMVSRCVRIATFVTCMPGSLYIYSEQHKQSVLSSGGESVAWVGSLYGTLPLHTSGLTTRRNLLSVFGGELVGPYALQRHSVVPFHWMGIHME